MKLSAFSILLLAALEAAVVNGQAVNGQGLRPPAWLNDSRNLGQSRDDCECFECVDDGTAKINDNGSKTVTISSSTCKSGTISWMCCIDTNDGDCKTATCSKGSPTGKTKGNENKCEDSDTMEVTVDAGATEVTIQAHDGQFATYGELDSAQCGGKDNTGSNIVRVSAGRAPRDNGICSATVDISKCFPTAAPETPAPTESPTSAPTASPTSAPTGAPTESPTSAPTAAPTESPTSAPTKSPTSAPETPAPTSSPTSAPTEAPKDRNGPPTDPPTKSKTGGDPHFTTWSGKKFDYHGECDLVLVNHPSFNDGQGLRVHIRTKRIGYFSYIETVAVQIGSDALVFANDLDTYTINGSLPSKTEKNWLGGFEVKQFKSALHISLDMKKRGNNKAHIDLFHRANGFPYVLFDGKMNPELFDGSEGLLGDWTTGRMIGRDGKTEFETINGDATDYALEWQVRDTDPMLFSSARHPQFPATCTPPEKMLGNRLGDTHMKKTAEEACAAWGEDKDECIFDVMATRNLDSAHPLSRHGNFAMEGPVGAA